MINQTLKNQDDTDLTIAQSISRLIRAVRADSAVSVCSHLLLPTPFVDACQVASVESNSVTPWTIACSLPVSSVYGILPARILGWVAVPSSRGSSWPRDRTRVSNVYCTGGWVLYYWRHLGSPLHYWVSPLKALVHWSWGKVNLWHESAVRPIGLPPKKSKPAFLPSLPLKYWPLSGEQPDPTFHNNNAGSFWGSTKKWLGALLWSQEDLDWIWSPTLISCMISENVPNFSGP